MSNDAKELARLVQDFIDANYPFHQWTPANEVVRWEHCSVCGVIRRRDDGNGPCKGAAPVRPRITAPEPEGDGRHVCPDCKNTFLQPFVCTTCGAQKLYDNTVLNLSNANEELRARCERMEAALEAGRVLEKALHACITNEEVEINGTSLGADIVAHALNTFHKLADALRGK